MDNYEQLDYLPFDPTIKRTQGTVSQTFESITLMMLHSYNHCLHILLFDLKVKDLTTGSVFHTTKGAPHVILDLLPPGSADIRDKVEADVARFGAIGVRSLAVARTDSESGHWMIVGLLTFLDPPREDTKQTIADAKKYHVDVKMITGDHLLIARNTARQLGKHGAGDIPHVIISLTQNFFFQIWVIASLQVKGFLY